MDEPSLLKLINETDWDRWSTFTGSRRSPIPKLFQQLLSDNSNQAAGAAERLLAALCNGYEVSPASAATWVVLVEMLPTVTGQLRAHVLDLMNCLAYHGGGQRSRDPLDFLDPPTGESRVPLNEPQAAQKLSEAIETSSARFIPMLDSDTPSIRELALAVLADSENQALVAPALASAILKSGSDDWTQRLLIRLGGYASSTYVTFFREYLDAPHTAIVRATACAQLAVVQRDGTPEAVADELRQVIRSRAFDGFPEHHNPVLFLGVPLILARSNDRDLVAEALIAQGVSDGYINDGTLLRILFGPQRNILWANVDSRRVRMLLCLAEIGTDPLVRAEFALPARDVELRSFLESILAR
jgi:hypothetical protein